MLTPPFTGRCLCRAVTYRCTAPPLWQKHCHCESCRRATASPFTSFFGMADGDWHWTGATPAAYESSPRTWREFCPTCGTQIAFHTDRILASVTSSQPPWTIPPPTSPPNTNTRASSSPGSTSPTGCPARDAVSLP